MNTLVKTILIISSLFMAMLVHANQISKPYLADGHPATVNQVIFSPDGQVYASAGYDNTIKLWETQSGNLIRTFTGHSSGVNSIAFSPDGRTLVSGSDDNTAKLWDLNKGNLIKTFKHDSFSVTSVAFNPDGQSIVTGSRIYSAQIWNVANGSLIKKITQNNSDEYLDYTNAVVYTPNGNKLVSINFSNQIRLWDMPSGRLIRTIVGDSEEVNSIAISPNGKMIASAGKDHLVKLWSTQRGTLMKSFSGHLEKVNSVQFSSDGQTLVSASSDKTIKLWNIKQGGLIKTIKGHSSGVLSVAFSPNGKILVSGGWDKTVRLWNVEHGTQIKSAKGGSHNVIGVAISPDKKIMAVLDYDRGRAVKLWDLENGRLLKVLKGHPSETFSITFSPDGKYLASSDTHRIKLWDVSKGTLVKNLYSEKKGVYYKGVTFSPDGETLMAKNTESILLWDIPSRKLIKEINQSKIISNTSFSPDGDYIVYAKGGVYKSVIELRDSDSGDLDKIIKSPQAYVKYVVFSPDGEFLATAGWDTIMLWDVGSGELVKTFKGHLKQVSSIAFSPDGELLVSGGADHTVKLWGVENGGLIKTFKGHSDYVYSVTFSSDGKLIASGSWDDTTRLWDVKSKKPISQHVTFDDGEWIIITKDGYFNASKNGAKHLNVRTGSRSATTIDAYYEKFYRPDIVKLIIAGKPFDVSERLADIKKAPRVDIIKTANASNKDNIKVTLKITDLGGGIGDIRLYRNDTAVKLDGSRALIRHKQTDKVLIKDYVIKLENGTNEIKAIAFDEKNWGRSEYATHLVTANIQARKPALHAVIIGIDNYRNSKLNLKYAVADAKLFSKSINKYSKSLFSEIKVDLLVTKSDTSKDAIVAKLKSMQSLNPEDLFVFYVASHGTVDDGSYFMITSNVGSTSTHKLKKDAVSQDTLKNLISNIPTTKKIIILDTCNSQAMGDSLQVAMMTRGMSEDTAMKVLSRAVGSTILSASTSTQEALEGYKGHGLFTHVLAEGLKGRADSNKDGFVKTNELADYIEDNVPELAEKIYKREQFPTTARNGLAYPISKVK